MGNFWTALFVCVYMCVLCVYYEKKLALCCLHTIMSQYFSMSLCEHKSAGEGVFKISLVPCGAIGLEAMYDIDFPTFYCPAVYSVIFLPIFSFCFPSTVLLPCCTIHLGSSTSWLPITHQCL